MKPCLDDILRAIAAQTVQGHTRVLLDTKEKLYQAQRDLGAFNLRLGDYACYPTTNPLEFRLNAKPDDTA